MNIIGIPSSNSEQRQDVFQDIELQIYEDPVMRYSQIQNKKRYDINLESQQRLHKNTENLIQNYEGFPIAHKYLPQIKIRGERDIVQIIKDENKVLKNFVCLAKFILPVFSYQISTCQRALKYDYIKISQKLSKNPIEHFYEMQYENLRKDLAENDYYGIHYKQIQEQNIVYYQGMMRNLVEYNLFCIWNKFQIFSFTILNINNKNLLDNFEEMFQQPLLLTNNIQSEIELSEFLGLLKKLRNDAKSFYFNVFVLYIFFSIFVLAVLIYNLKIFQETTQKENLKIQIIVMLGYIGAKYLLSAYRYIKVIRKILSNPEYYQKKERNKLKDIIYVFLLLADLFCVTILIIDYVNFNQVISLVLAIFIFLISFLTRKKNFSKRKQKSKIAILKLQLLTQSLMLNDLWPTNERFPTYG